MSGLAFDPKPGIVPESRSRFQSDWATLWDRSGTLSPYPMKTVKLACCLVVFVPGWAAVVLVERPGNAIGEKPVADDFRRPNDFSFWGSRTRRRECHLVLIQGDFSESKLATDYARAGYSNPDSHRHVGFE